VKTGAVLHLLVVAAAGTLAAGCAGPPAGSGVPAGAAPERPDATAPAGAAGGGPERPAQDAANAGATRGDTRPSPDEASATTPSADAPAPAPPRDSGEREARAAAVDAGGPRPVLLFTRSTGFVHDSTTVAAQTIAAAARAAGFAPEISDDPARFTPAALARYEAVVLIATAGEPLGGAAAIDALAAFVREGGGLVGIENATNAHVGSAAYVALFGAVFAGHPGGIRRVTCLTEGDHPSVAALPTPWEVNDEIYVFTRFRADNQVVLRCAAERLPVAWHRTEGRGRIFYTALGHLDEAWTRSRLVPDHVLPALSWAARR
jgi:hypothetical protein